MLTIKEIGQSLIGLSLGITIALIIFYPKVPIKLRHDNYQYLMIMKKAIGIRADMQMNHLDKTINNIDRIINDTEEAIEKVNKIQSEINKLNRK